ncbi:MAG: hypothetical protein R3C12_22960 [Planctomycetaceae bacterium]
MRFDLGGDDLSRFFPRFEQAFITNYDGAAFPSRVQCEGRELRCIRQKSESGKLNIPWPVRGQGIPILRTCSLIEREAPYILAVELARGQLGELRDQAASWSHAGMLIPDEYNTATRHAYKLFLQASFAQEYPAEATKLANAALVEICRAEEMLVNAYISQRMQVRRQRFAHPPPCSAAIWESSLQTNCPLILPMPSMPWRFPSTGNRLNRPRGTTTGMFLISRSTGPRDKNW